MYAGLTISDKPALLDARAAGAEWVAREGNEEGDLFAYRKKPEKDLDLSFWSSVDGIWIGIENEMLQFIQWNDAEPVNIDLALAQIAEMESNEKALLSEKASEKGCAEMESAEKPLTVNEWINQASVEEKAKWMSDRGYCPENFFDCNMYEDCKACWKAMLTIPYHPYTEGEKV